MENNTINEIDEVKEQYLNLFNELYNNCMKAGVIDVNLYEEFDVKRGLRDTNGRGVLTGLTEISDVVSTEIINGTKYPTEGKLYYHGYNIMDILENQNDCRYAFEEITYLLLFGSLPSQTQLESFISIMKDYATVSNVFTRDVIMKAPSANIMNALQKSLITLYSYDENPEDTTAKNVLRQSMQLIAKMPSIAVHAYHAYRHMKHDETLLIRNPKPEYSIAENILYMLRENGEFSPIEARTLDVALVLHAEHGGGNNSTFTTHVVTSSGTDTYSAYSAAVASLKGSRHGGANIKAKEMLDYFKENVSDWNDEAEILDILTKILNKEAFDKSGLVYGMGHAVYTLSDPRQVILKKYAKKLAEQKSRMDEFMFFDRIEQQAKKAVAQHRHLFKPFCANVDFYSGFVYDMLEIPPALFTPIFAISRLSGWSAHRLEELINNGKIVRPAYKYVGAHKQYLPIDKR